MQKSKKCQSLFDANSDIRFIPIFFCLRCVDGFNQVYKYSLLVYHTWLMLSLCSTLVTVQFALVEYCELQLFNIEI